MPAQTFTAPPTAPTTQNPTNFDALADLLVAWLSTMTAEHTTFSAYLATLVPQLLLAAAPGGIVLTYSFDGASAAVANPGNGKLRLNNLSQSGATAMLANNLDSLNVSATPRLSMLTSTSAIKGTVFVYKGGDPTKWLVGRASANTAATGYYNITIGSVQTSTANPFTDGDSLVMILVPQGDAGGQGPQGPTALWTTDATYPISGSPALITIPLPTSAATCRLRLEGLALSASSQLVMSLSTNGGSSFGTGQILAGNSSGSVFSGFILLEGLGRDFVSIIDGVQAGASVPASPNLSGPLAPRALFAKPATPVTHVQFQNSGPFTGGTIIAEKK